MIRFRAITLLLLVGGILMIMGCSDSRNEVVKSVLEAKYGEEMLVHRIVPIGNKYEAICSPANNPEVVFEARMFVDGTNEWDDYYKRYTAKLMNDIVKEDLQQFFPDTYIRTYANLYLVDDSMDFTNHTLEEIISNSDGGGSKMSGAFTHIYINKEVGTTQNYEAEYEYFTKTIDQYIEEKRMIPLCVTFYWIDEETKENVETFFQTDLDIDSSFDNEILGVDSYKSGVNTFEGTDVGDPPNIVACFDKDAPTWIGSKEEYIRRREILENQ